ncbi:aminotransferase class I/II-fold pyridoxal phosphate-dependent enzyme [Glutamicibacter creatinolyticus]|uniref:aminotransferase class I/II-fold pyridoxal phosphate-dependent enzyme n=1 Tax=Glutamicibacter creatinolyticus TaxID=162496 RepID=UPI0037BEA122
MRPLPRCHSGPAPAKTGKQKWIAPRSRTRGSGKCRHYFPINASCCGTWRRGHFGHPSFEGYSVLAATSGASTIVVDLDAQGRLDLERMAQAVTDKTRLVAICSPNNPTGTTVSRIEFERFHTKVPSDVLILLDEAYAEFVTDPEAFYGLRDVSVLRHPNVVVLRTFSKAYGLAGLRIGYAVGHPRVLDAARATAIPLSLTGLAEVAALASLEAEMELRERIANLIQNRDGLQARLRNTGIAVPEAQGNFVWLPVGEAATGLGEMFDQAGLVVRVFPSMGVRITVGDVNSVAVVADVVAAYQLASRLVQ